MKKIALCTFLSFLGLIGYSQNTPTWTGTGNIGIGTVSPQCNLHLLTNGTTQLRIQRSSTTTSQNNFMDIFFSSSPAAGITLGGGSAIFRLSNISADASPVNTTNGDIAFMPKSTVLGMVIKPDAKVGIGGVQNPASVLQVNGDFMLGSTNTGARWKFDPASGSSGNYLRLGYDDGSGVFKHPFSIQRQSGYVGVGTDNTYLSAQLHVIASYGFNSGAEMPVLALERRSSPTSSTSGKWTFNLIADPTFANQSSLTFNSDQGNVFRLYPNADAKLGGKLTCKEVKVTNSPWADYVFDDDYQLMSIDSLENYIQVNNHLPNVPTTDEITLNGNNIAETEKILLEKIEELTLYMIELNKKIDLLKEENNLLKKTISE